MATPTPIDRKRVRFYAHEIEHGADVQEAMQAAIRAGALDATEVTSNFDAEYAVIEAEIPAAMDRKAYFAALDAQGVCL
jgi:hypothetical protein